MTAVNSLSIDHYVQGVVAGEMPSSLGHRRAARPGRCGAHLRAGDPKSGDVFDQYPDTRSQVYRGVEGETSRTNRAVRDTGSARS